MAAVRCESCDFDFRHLAATLQSPRPEEGPELLLTCPMCGAGVVLRYSRLGVLLRGSGGRATFVRWRLTAKDEPKPVVRHGRFAVRFDAPLDSIEPRDICYARLPVFVDEGGQLVVPSVPIRPDFIDCLDDELLAAMREKGDTCVLVGGQIQVTLPLRGIAEPVRLSLPIQAPAPGAASRENAYAEVNVRVWPPFALPGWKHYLVGVAGTSQAADGLVAGGVLRARAVSAGSEWQELSVKQRAGGAIVQVFDAPPRWVALEIYDPRRPDAPIGGGLFAVALPGRTPAGVTRIGLDFGTSNSCVAVDGDMTRHRAGPEHLPVTERELTETSWNHYLLRGGFERDVHAGPDLWPPVRGFGFHRDLLPSEILIPGQRRELPTQLPRMGQWRFGLDFGIPGWGAKPTYSESDHLVADFKWAASVNRDIPEQHVSVVQSTYLAALLMTMYVRAALTSGVCSTQLDVQWSYPMAFTDSDIDRLSTAGELAQRKLADLTGLSWTLSRGVDESTAAAVNAGTLDPAVCVEVYLDMGGGSTDIAVKVLRGNDRWEVEYLTSIAYAGGALLDGYAGMLDRSSGKRTGSCLVGANTVDVLRRRVRECTNASEVLSDPTLFNSGQELKTRKRTRHFYAYLIEYVARIVAAGIFDLRFQRQVSGASTFPEELAVAFFILGNGWGFFNDEAVEIPTLLCDAIFRRVGVLLKSEAGDHAKQVRAQLKGVRIDKRVGILRDLPRNHPKAAVAFGVLVAGEVRHKTHTRAGVLGWNTLVGREEIPWYARYTRSGVVPARALTSAGSDDGVIVIDDEPDSSTGGQRWYKPIPAGTRLDWGEAGPALPDDLIGPFDLDANLNSSRGDLQRQCPSGEGWFRKGPYEVMLEVLLKPRLGEIA